MRAARAASFARFFSALVDAGASDETLRAASASFRLGVGRPFLFELDCEVFSATESVMAQL
jgi:hypothetical protein